MKFYLSNSAFLGNIDPSLQSFDPSEPEKLEITANKRWVGIHPVILAMIAALSLLVDKKNVSCEKIIAKSGHYLSRMGLFRFLGTDQFEGILEHDASGRFVPLTQIKNSTELTQFLTDMIPLLHLDPKHAESIRYIVSELVRNVLEHSQSKQGALVAAQYHKKSNKIRIGIADTGLGIRKTISHSYSVKSDSEAIHLALMPGITGTTRREGGSEFNAGAGLFFIKSIASVNRDFFILYSGTTLYKLLKRTTKSPALQSDPARDRHSENTTLPLWQGTVVGIDISLDTTQEFTALLDLIRTTYGQAVRERRKERYKKPRFI